MSFCPYCEHLLAENTNKCTKCGAILSSIASSSLLQCPKCGGILKGTEKLCPWCGSPRVPFSVESESEAYRILKNLENGLRQFIKEMLSKIDENWWETRVPAEVRIGANFRKMRDERVYPWHVQKDLHPIYYVIFSDYAKIIVLDINWDQVFNRFFKNRLIIATKLRELEPIRDAIAHGRDVSTKDLQKLKLYSEEIMACIASASKPIESKKLLYGEVAAKVGLDYGVLRINYLQYEHGILQMEFEKGGLGNVIKPRPIQVTKKFDPKIKSLVEKEINTLLRFIASSLTLQALQITCFHEIINKVGQAIYSVIPTSIVEQLQEMPNGSLLTLSLDDRVLGWPWELAYDGSEYLCTKFGVGRIIYSEAVLPIKRKERRETRILLISNPDGTLPHTDTEIADPLMDKMERFGAQVDHFSSSCSDLRFYPSKKNILSALESGLYDIIHYVGHGAYDPNHPERSSLSLADNEELLAKEISDALNQAINLGKQPPLLFYSHSCEAGAQQSWDMQSYEAQILGLPAAFIKFNIAYIGALWSASFKGADQIALQFYDELLDKGQPAGLALRNARLSVKNRASETCDWANFILYGDPSLIIKI